MSYKDPITEEYMKLVESYDVGRREKQEPSADNYETTEDGWDSYAKMDHIEVLHRNIGRLTQYKTVDHNQKVELHSAEVYRSSPTKYLPFEHEFHADINVSKNKPLPKYFGTDLAYNHFGNSDFPMRSADDQHTGGAAMWNRLAHKALEDGHHVYRANGYSLEKIDKNNIEKHLGEFHKQNEAEGHKNHIIISKTLL